MKRIIKKIIFLIITISTITNVYADEIESKTEYFCPGCSLKIDDRLWRKFRMGFFVMEETTRLTEKPAVEVRLFRSQYQRLEENNIT